MAITDIATGSRRGATLLVALALILTLFAGRVLAQETDGTPPTVEISPPEGGVAQPSDDVTATFSESMDTSSVNVNTFNLTRDGDTDPVRASVTPDGDSDTVFTLNPSGELDQGATYMARIEGATDLAHNALDMDSTAEGNQAKVWSFEVADIENPTVTLVSPGASTEARDSLLAAATADDNVGVVRVEFIVDGGTPAETLVEATGSGGSYSAEIDTSDYAHDSNHTVAARAFDADGNASEVSPTRSVTIDREVSLSLGDTPAPDGLFDEVPSLSFTTDTDVAADDRQCRAFGNVATAGAFATCASPYLPTLQTDGGYTYEVRVTDDAGNTTTPSRSFTLDRTAPNLTLDSGPDGGTFGPDTTQTWTFSAKDVTSGPPEVRCSVVEAGSPTSYGPCDTAGSHSVSDRPGGSYVFSLRATDGAGNERVLTRTFRIDAVAPSAALTAPAAGTKVGKTMTLAATADDDLAAPKVEFLVDGELKRTVGTAPYSATLDMALYPDGGHTVAARAVDGVGNVSPLSEVEITLDRQVSLTLGDTPVQGSRTNAASVPLSFRTDPDVPPAGLECRAERGGVPPEPYAPCTSPYAPELAQDGVYIYRVRATDDAGNQRTDSRTFTFDKTPPTLAVNGPNDRVFGPGTRQEWTLSAGDATSGLSGVECSVAGVDTSPNYGSCAAATSHFAANKPEGSYELRVRATDGAGNATEVVRTFVIDATPPAVTIHAGLPDNAATNQTSLAWAFSAEAGATFECRVYGVGTTPPAFGPCSEEGRHTAGSLAQGRYTFEVRGLDALGNRLDGPSAGRTFTVDRTAPRVSGVTPAVNAKNVAPGANVTVTFTERMQLLTLGRANFKLIRSGTSTPVAAAVTFNPATNRATLNPTNPLQRGTTYRVVVTTGARDLANNHLLFPKSWIFKVK